VVAVDYDRYAILKMCRSDTNTGKYVFRGILNVCKVKYIRRFHKFQKTD